MTLDLLENVEGLIYSLNFSQPFNTNDSKIDSLPGGVAHNIAPNYIDGAMFSDDYEYALYGQVILSRLESGILMALVVSSAARIVREIPTTTNSWNIMNIDQISCRTLLASYKAMLRKP